MSVSDIGNILSQQYVLGVLRGRVDDVSRQSSTGYKSDTIAGMGTNSVASALSYRNTSNLLNAYTSNLNATKSRLSITDTALTSITQVARDFVSELQSQLQDTTPSAALLSGAAKNALQNVTDKLNTQADGRYVFSGQNFDTAGFGNMSGLLTNIGTLVSSAMANPATTSTTIQTDVSAVSGTSLGLNSAAINGGTINIPADENSAISISLNASSPGFSDILRGMAIVANLPQPTTAAEQKNYWSMLNGAINLITQGATAVDNAQAVLGDQAKNVDNLIDQHSETQTNLSDYLSSVEDVDEATAATKFSSLQTQLQTSYSIIAATKDLSLVKYL